MSINRIIRKIIPASDFTSKLLMKRQLNRKLANRLPADVLKQYEDGTADSSKIFHDLSSRYPEKTNELLKKCKSMSEDMKINYTEDMGKDAVICYFGYGFEVDEYMGFELHAKDVSARKEYLSNRERSAVNVGLNDVFDRANVGYKDTAYEFYKKYFKREALVSSKCTFERFSEFIEKYGAAVIKKPTGSNGSDVSFIRKKDISNLKHYYNAEINGKELLIEQPIKQSAAMAVFNDSSVNTVRIVCLNTDQGVAILHCIFRVGRNGSFVDNASAGGVFAAVDVKTGIITGNGQDTQLHEYGVHPDTKVKFDGYRLPEWEKALSITREITSMLPKVKYISWDFAHTDDGWVIVEGNEGGRLRMVQMAEKHGIKQEFVSIIRSRISASLKKEVLAAMGEKL